MHDSDRFIYGAKNVGITCTYEGEINFSIKHHMLICYSSFYADNPFFVSTNPKHLLLFILLGHSNNCSTDMNKFYNTELYIHFDPNTY
jgi:hypothetical protein